MFSKENDDFQDFSYVWSGQNSMRLIELLGVSFYKSSDLTLSSSDRKAMYSRWYLFFRNSIQCNWCIRIRHSSQMCFSFIALLYVALLCCYVWLYIVMDFLYFSQLSWRSLDIQELARLDVDSSWSQSWNFTSSIGLAGGQLFWRLSPGLIGGIYEVKLFCRVEMLAVYSCSDSYVWIGEYSTSEWEVLS